MKDCTKCKDRVELHPEYKRMKWDQVPCSKCQAVQPFGKNERFKDTILYKQANRKKKEDQETMIQLLSHVFRSWLQLGELERNIIAERVLRPELTHAEVAALYKVSRPTLYKSYRRIVTKFPILSPLTPYKGRTGR